MSPAMKRSPSRHRKRRAARPRIRGGFQANKFHGPYQPRRADPGTAPVPMLVSGVCTARRGPAPDAGGSRAALAASARAQTSALGPPARASRAALAASARAQHVCVWLAGPRKLAASAEAQTYALGRSNRVDSSSTVNARALSPEHGRRWPHVAGDETLALSSPEHGRRWPDVAGDGTLVFLFLFVLCCVL